jgi:hypothetical protein
LGFFLPREATLLVDGQSTAANLRLYLMAMARRPPRHLLLFFTGHGNENEIWFSDGPISYRELGHLLRAIRSRTKTVVLATCHAGGATRLFETGRFGGENRGRIRRAWAQALAAAVPGLRVVAAVGENEVAHADPVLGTGRFVHAWIDALRRGEGDLNVDGFAFVSDLQSAREAGRNVIDRWSGEPGPEFYCEGQAGTLPLVRSQSPGPVGLAYVEYVRSTPAMSAELAVRTFDRRGVGMRACWEARAVTGALVGSGCVAMTPRLDVDCLRLSLPADERRVLDDYYLGFWLRQGLGVELTWRVRLLDDHDRLLQTAGTSTTYWLPADVA